MIKVGNKVTVRTGLNNIVITSEALVAKVSRAGVVITVLMPGRQNIQMFYRNASGTRYVNNPGAGICGALLNDYIAAQ